MSTQIVQTSDEIAKLAAVYEELSRQAHFDTVGNIHYQAAFHAPAAFLLNEKISNFEITFDRIIYHLDFAYKLVSADDEMKRAVSSTADDLFSKIVFVIQSRLLQNYFSEKAAQKISHRNIFLWFYVF